ncbi:MAG: aminotransferase class III-fold pyridoxal phosphate-dependent enzyme [Legionellaceae bacterium]|nr:aminotransferase class III-fold pyridoxal phosphate-dependent enzyme [Legionellaceae bacterium]
MPDIPSLLKKERAHIWPPATRGKDRDLYPPLMVYEAEGCYLQTHQGPLIDAISSWWCKPLGHKHPAVISAIQTQLQKFEHVIAANTTHERLITLGEHIARHTQLPYSFFACDGSSAVEIALKMAVHAQQIQGHTQKTGFIALKNGYHGETLGALSVTDMPLYKSPYAACTLPCTFIDPHAPFEEALLLLEPIATTTAACIFEPLIQGSNGMHPYPIAFLEKLIHWAQQQGIYCIADEIMTGLCRLGQWLACDSLSLKPDMICLSKGLCAGALPMSCVSLSGTLYNLFHEDHPSIPAFLHSHTQSANALAVAAAVTTLEIMEQENFCNKAQHLGDQMYQRFKSIAERGQHLHHIRQLGAIVAGDLPCATDGLRLAQEAAKRGALLRPMGNTLYWFPPLIMDINTLDKLAKITEDTLIALYG